MSIYLWVVVVIIVIAFVAFLILRRMGRRSVMYERLPPRYDHLPTSSGFDSLDRRASARQPPADAKPLYSDENVTFSVYCHKVVAPEHGHRLLAFAHLSERRPDSPPGTPDPVREVEREAERTFGPQATSLLGARLPSAHAVPHKGELTFVPRVEGVEFNPPRQTILWLSDWQKVEFRMYAAREHDGRHLRGSLTVFLGNLILADIPLSFYVDGSHVPQEDEPRQRVSARPYLKVFPSYSHKDMHIVEEYAAYVESLGHEYMRDVKTLRAGQLWNEQLMRLIKEAEVFQLFWSSNSMRSRFVRQEWEYALSLKRDNFVRPTYWEEPMPEDDGLPPEELARIHFYKLQRAAESPTSARIDDLARAHAQRRTLHAPMNCPRCQHTLRDDAAFCHLCGLAITTSPPSASMAAPYYEEPEVMMSAPASVAHKSAQAPTQFGAHRSAPESPQFRRRRLRSASSLKLLPVIVLVGLLLPVLLYTFQWQRTPSGSSNAVISQRVEEPTPYPTLYPKATPAPPSDAALRLELLEAFSADERLRGTEIKVEVTYGVIVLSGTVENERQRLLALDIAERVRGVRRVIDHLMVLRPTRPNSNSRSSAVRPSSR